MRTTAYTHTEEDHVAYGNHNALGGVLQAAAPPAPPPVATPVAAGGFHPVAFTPAPPLVEVYGSAAADWSRWPAGTVFRLLSSGQLYQVDDYGWALSGRNTIDLYMADRASMDAWEVRREDIQILRWGDRSESLRVLRPREKFRHIRRMVLELEGNSRAAARMD